MDRALSTFQTAYLCASYHHKGTVLIDHTLSPDLTLSCHSRDINWARRMTVTIKLGSLYLPTAFLGASRMISEVDQKKLFHIVAKHARGEHMAMPPAAAAVLQFCCFSMLWIIGIIALSLCCHRHIRTSHLTAQSTNNCRSKTVEMIGCSPRQAIPRLSGFAGLCNQSL